MGKFKLSRRAVIRGAGTIAIALPWLEIMGESRPARGQSTTKMPFKRFVTVYQPGGTVRQPTDNYTPTGSDTSLTLTGSKILAPLDPVKSKLLVIDGLNCTCGDQSKYSVEQHQGGGMGFLTGGIQPGANNFMKSSPSIDQVLAQTLSKGQKKGSLQFAVRWATGKTHGLLSPMNATNFEMSGSAISPMLDPQMIFNTYFGTLTGSGTVTDDSATIAATRKKSILDFVDKRYATLAAKLGAADKARLQEHLDKIRLLETSLTIPDPKVTATCKPPMKVDTSDYNPTSGLNSSDNGSIKDTKTDAAIPKVGKFMMDMLVMALACEYTSVVSFQWSDTEAKHTFPWLNLSEHHHYYQHDGGFRANECTQIATWYSQQHLYLLQQMQAIDMGGHSLLDESVVLFGTEIADPPSHGKTNMPIMLAGGGGGLRTGRYIKFSGQPHNKLLTSIFNLAGDPRTSFGDSRVDSSPLSGSALT
jgi:hypothetical protein